MKVGKGGKGSFIDRDELIEYSKRPSSRVRLLRAERMGDGFIYQNRENFYVNLDWLPNEPYMLKPGEIIGIEVEGRMGFYPKTVVL